MEIFGTNPMTVKYTEYDRLDGLIKDSMKRSASEVVQLGYFLRRMMEEGLYSVYYTCFDAYLEEEVHMDYTMASRFIGINKKYSVGGQSEVIDEKYEDYSQGVLIEMLSMPPELEVKVTPEMTVKQVRKIKQEARQKNIKMKPDVRGLMSDAYCAVCGNPLDDDTRPTKCPECGQMQDWEWYMRTYWPKEGDRPSVDTTDTVVDGDYREIGETEEIATSQAPVLERPDARGQEYLKAFARYFISCKKEWMLEDFSSRVIDVTKSPQEIKSHLNPNSRNWFFSVEGGVASINLFDDYVQLWDENTDCMGNFEWFYLAAAIQSMWNVVSLEAAQQNGGKENTESALEKKAGSADTPKKCITGQSRYGVCSCCGYEGVQCCSQCETNCNSRCGWIDEPYSPEEENREEKEIEALPLDGITAVRSILTQEKKLLSDYLEAGGIPERTLFRQKTIVGALAAMVCDLENADQEDGSEQPELPDMTNNSQRGTFLDSYKEWPVWIDTPETGERYYRYLFPNGAGFVVKVYFHRCFDYKSEASNFEDRFHEDWGSEEYYILLDGRYFRDCRSNKTAMVDFLKDLQKKGEVK